MVSNLCLKPFYASIAHKINFKFLTPIYKAMNDQIVTYLSDIISFISSLLMLLLVT